uniref:serine C-palmitoyltransferase n=1 Tax=Leersia perrieri TaxID=77586 RepID=A0A0D9V5D0_9ORYZ
MAQWDALVDRSRGWRRETSCEPRVPSPSRHRQAPAPPETFAGPGPWDRAAVEIRLDHATLHQWLAKAFFLLQSQEEVDEKLILFSGNDYMGLSPHPALRKDAVKAAQEYSMGPRGSALICGYTTFHKLAEDVGDCVICPTEFSANMAVMTALGSVSSLLSVGRKPAERERIPVSLDALNHASIIDGIRLVERQEDVVAFVYKHCDMHHLDFLLLFSMDGDFAPLPKLAWNTCLWREWWWCENGIDISIGTLSKDADCHAALHVSRKERWRRSVIWGHVQFFASLTKLDITSPIISIVVGSEEAALRAGRHMLRSGFHVTPIRPPTVPQNSCRLRITISASHSLDGIKRLVDALSPWLPDKHYERTYVMASKLGRRFSVLSTLS